MEIDLKQRTRVILLFADLLLLSIFSRLAFDSWFPALGNSGFWFYTALLSLLLGNRLITPFYNKPVDVVAYSVSALVALLVVNDWGKWVVDEKLIFSIAIGYCSILLVASFVQVFTKDSTEEWIQQLSTNLRTTVNVLGAPRALYSVVIWFAIYTFHRNSAKELLWVGAAWATTVAFSPLDALVNLGKKLRYQWLPGNLPKVIGEVIAYQNPGIFLIRQLRGKSTPFGSPLLISDSLAQSSIAIALDYVGRDEGRLQRAVEVKAALPVAEIESRLGSLPDNIAAEIDLGDVKSTNKRSQTILADLQSLVGIVAPETSIERLYFEVIKEEELEEGRLIETFIGDKPVIYQIVNGVTKEEVVHQKNTYGYARAQAQKIGVWQEDAKHFELAKWLPQLNTPVFLKQETETAANAASIGHFPKTNFTVGIKDINDLVTHNTAILGILGVGKSMIAIELLERMMTTGIKVICLDLTNQYAKELAEFYDPEYEAPRLEKIAQAGQVDRDKWDEDPEQGGSIPAFTDAIRNDLSEFFHSDNPHMLKIYNPSQLFATKQVSDPKSFMKDKQWHRQAPLWTVTPVEVTRIVSEATLALLQDEMVDYARACLVYEEAHSLVPEWNSVAFEGDKAATNGTARAILQGRKYGLGCLLITQRTANVTKTILNQCNTVLAMRTFDETGKVFLANYIGQDYASSLSSLPERHAVFFGKGSTCENPVLIRLNDREDFKTVFRAKHPPPALPKEEQVENIGEEAQGMGQTDDDVPF